MSTQPAAKSTALTFTRFTSVQPAQLTKEISLNADGGLEKKAAAQMIKGKMERMFVSNLSAFSELLNNLSSAQALSYGVCPLYEHALVVTADALDGANKRNEGNVIARTRQYCQFVAAPGIMMFRS